MPQTKCPNCRAATLPAMGRFYCQRCGWGRDAAERRFVRVQWIIPGLIAIFDFMGIVALGIERHNWAGAILFATLPTLLLGFVYAGARQGLARLRAPAPETSATDEATSLAASADASAEKETSQQYDFLLSLPAPRPVQLSRRGKRLLTVLLLFAFGMEVFLLWVLYGIWFRASATGDSRAPAIFLLCFMVLIASLPFFVRRSMVRDQDLLENGAVAMARVTGQRNFKNASAITYEFQNGTGQTVSGSGNDLTRSFYSGMTVPVFYDPQKAKRHVAVCSSFFEIANPSNE
jgi:hypothetical protein